MAQHRRRGAALGQTVSVSLTSRLGRRDVPRLRLRLGQRDVPARVGVHATGVQVIQTDDAGGRTLQPGVGGCAKHLLDAGPPVVIVAPSFLLPLGAHLLRHFLRELTGGVSVHAVPVERATVR